MSCREIVFKKANDYETKSRLVLVDVRIAELKVCWSEMSPAMAKWQKFILQCWQELAFLKSLNSVLACKFKFTRNFYGKATRFEYARAHFVLQVSFFHKNGAHLIAEVVTMTHKPDLLQRKAKQLLLEVQSVLGTADQTYRLRVFVMKMRRLIFLRQ